MGSKKVRFSFKTNVQFDIALLNEVESLNPFAFQKPKKVWEEIAKKLVDSELKMPVTHRSCKIRTEDLLADFANDENLSNKVSGVSEDELGTVKYLLTNIRKLANEKPSQSAKKLYSKSSRCDGEKTRDQALQSIIADSSSSDEAMSPPVTPVPDATNADESQSVCQKVHEDTECNPEVPNPRKRVRKGDVVSYLKEKHESEMDFKKEELKIRMQEVENRRMELDLAKEKHNCDIEIKKMELELLKTKQELESQERRALTDALIHLVNKK